MVLEPFESIITETRTGPKKVAATLSRIASPAATTPPPIPLESPLEIEREEVSGSEKDEKKEEPDRS